MTDGLPHPGITVQCLRVGGGAAGLIFAIGSLLSFFIGLPEFWGFLAVPLLAGMAVSSLWIRKPLRITTIGGNSGGL
jgi:hypothetical protein